MSEKILICKRKILVVSEKILVVREKFSCVCVHAYVRVRKNFGCDSLSCSFVIFLT